MLSDDVRKASQVVITNLRSGEEMGRRIVIANSFWKRFRGLMGTSPLQKGEGMLFPHTNSVHMFFMRYSLVIAYLTKDFRVLRLVVLNPWQIGPIMLGAYWVLELPHDAEGLIAAGDALRVTETTFET